MKTLKQYLQEAKQGKTAIGHFNASDITGLKAIFESAKELNLPVVIGVSEGERKFIGVKQIALLVKSLRDEFNYPIFLNADHTKTFDGIKEAVEAGFDAVMLDTSELALEENIKAVKEAITWAKEKNPEIVFEGEIGYLGGNSALIDSLPENFSANYTKPEEAEKFFNETGVDLLAISVGNVHGMLKNISNPKLDIELIKTISEKLPVPLVLHGGSGISDEDFKLAIQAGISQIHINTELRVAWRRGIDEAIKDVDEVIPYKLLKPSFDKIKEITQKRLKLFAGMVE